MSESPLAIWLHIMETAQAYYDIEQYLSSGFLYQGRCTESFVHMSTRSDHGETYQELEKVCWNAFPQLQSSIEEKSRLIP